jgi:UDP-N-acetylglucosamine 2-epimerase (non-hydrolysing)
MQLDLVVATRPNFVKAAPVWRALSGRPGARVRLIHTGQHYSPEMSERLFAELRLPASDVQLEVGSGTNSDQIARTMLKLDPLLRADRPDVLVIFGDVNATVAAALVAAEVGVPVAHVEAGLRSFDRTMPEEHNRIVADALSRVLFTTCRDAEANLLREGVAKEQIYFVGNVMIDTLIEHLESSRTLAFHRALRLRQDRYALLTLHRPSNVDEPTTFLKLLEALAWLQGHIPVVFPIHPRTHSRLQELGLAGKLATMPGVHAIPPCSYVEFLSLMGNATLVLTDSGGIQEETTYLGIPCLTLRENTERPVTIEVGTNELVGTNPKAIRAAGERILSGQWKSGRIPEKWDGQAADRIAEILLAAPPAQVQGSETAASALGRPG